MLTFIPNAWSQWRVHVLGTAQDAGRPQVGCMKTCCVDPQGRPQPHEPVVALGITPGSGNSPVLVEATPDLPAQWNHLQSIHDGLPPQSIFITHAHMGHYTGLMYLGREALNSKNIEVYGGPRFITFLETDQPWKQLVGLHNIWPRALVVGDRVQLAGGQIEALQVPHRDEISDTYGYLIHGPAKRLLFIPDIDKWCQWNMKLDSLLETVEYALLDATFYSEGELPGRSMSEIPHPFVRETLDLAQDWPWHVKQKVYFIHYNHSNPLLDPQSDASKEVEAQGFRLARTGMYFDL